MSVTSDSFYQLFGQIQKSTVIDSCKYKILRL